MTYATFSGNVMLCCLQGNECLISLNLIDDTLEREHSEWLKLLKSCSDSIIWQSHASFTKLIEFESLTQIMLVTWGWMVPLNKNKAWKKCSFIFLINSLSMLHMPSLHIINSHICCSIYTAIFKLSCNQHILSIYWPWKPAFEKECIQGYLIIWSISFYHFNSLKWCKKSLDTTFNLNIQPLIYSLKCNARFVIDCLLQGDF